MTPIKVLVWQILKSVRTLIKTFQRLPQTEWTPDCMSLINVMSTRQPTTEDIMNSYLTLSLCQCGGPLVFVCVTLVYCCTLYKYYAQCTISTVHLSETEDSCTHVMTIRTKPQMSKLAHNTVNMYIIQNVRLPVGFSLWNPIWNMSVRLRAMCVPNSVNIWETISE